MKIRKILSISCILLLMVVFSSASFAKVISFVTDPIGYSTYGSTAALANIINKYNDVDLELKVKPTTGAIEIAGLFATGEAQMGVHNSMDSPDVWLTKGEFAVYDEIEKVIPLRLLFFGGPFFDSAITYEGTGIKTGADMAGKRFVGDFSAAPEDTAKAQAFLASWNLTKDDVLFIKAASTGDGVRMLISGRADVVGDMVLNNADTIELDAKKGARWLSWNTSPDAMERMAAVLGEDVLAKFMFMEVEPHPALSGITEKTTMIRFDDYYMCRADQISDEEAYGIVKVLLDHLDEVREAHANLSLIISPEYMVSDSNTVPYHPGVVKLFKDRGLWTEKHETRQNELLALEKEELK